MKTPPENKIKTYWVGIDGSVATCGFAVWYNKAFIEVSGCSFWECIRKLDNVHSLCKKKGYYMTVVVENVLENKPVFDNRLSGNQRKDRAISQSVGQVKAATRLIIDYCKMNGYCTVLVKPQKKSLTKLNSTQFKAITRWPKRTNQDGRDAAMLVFGRC